ncbi:MAG: FHA domain-containing protein [Planctomycetota bacterium]|nr:MAG: FHA domain-containing protein [Planctomycetota bacterium]
MGRPLRWYVREYDDLGPVRFAAEHRHPFLRLLARPLAEDGSDSGSGRFVTMRVGKNLESVPDPLELPVYSVRKVEGKNVFAMMITVGRAPNNDIQIDASSISKFHAYLEERDGAWSIRDANSSNGTFVNEVPVANDASTPLAEGDEVRFARAKCRFHTHEGFVELLAREAERLRQRGTR